MTQYYEAEANDLEYLACLAKEPGEQVRLWAAASLVGTPVAWCPSGYHVADRGGTYGPDCEDICRM